MLLLPGTPVSAAMGDLQCSVKSTLEDSDKVLLDIVKPKSNSKSQIQVPNPSHKFKSKKLKSKVQRKRNGTGADIIILQATHPTHNFSHLKFDLQTSMRGQNGVEFDQESTGHV